MPRITAPRHIVDRVNALYSWPGVEKSALGYPDKSPVVSALSGRSGYFGPIIPDVDLPAPLREVRRALEQLRVQNSSVWLAIHLRHTESDSATKYTQETGYSSGSYYNSLDRGYWFIAGVVGTS